MKKSKKKMYLMSAMAMTFASALCFSSCSTDFWTIDDIATTSSTFYIIGYIEGFNKGIDESGIEFKTENLIDGWWNKLLGKEEKPNEENPNESETPNEGEGSTESETPNEGEGSTESETPGSEEGNE